MRQDEFYNLARSESDIVSAKRDEEEEEEEEGEEEGEGDLWLEPRWNVTGPPQCPHMNERQQVNTTSWPRAHQRTTKNHLLCSLSCCHSLIYWPHMHAHTHTHTHTTTHTASSFLATNVTCQHQPVSVPVYTGHKMEAAVELLIYAERPQHSLMQL